MSEIGFREKLNKLIKQKKIRGYQIAESIGISPAAVSRWRQGQSFPRCIELYKLSKVLGVTMEELIEEDV